MSSINVEVIKILPLKEKITKISIGEVISNDRVEQ